MKILLTVPSLAREFGGPAAKARRLAAGLRDLGHSVVLVGCGEAVDATGLPVLLKFHATPVPRRLRPLPALARSADIVHVIGYRDPVGTLAAVLARRGDVPLVVEPEGMLPRHTRSRRSKALFDERIGFRMVADAAAVVVTSEVERAWLPAIIDRASVRIRPNGVDVEGLLPLPERGAFRSELGIAPSASLVLVLARFVATKGLPAFVSALASTDAVGVIAGPDERDGTLDEVRRRVSDLGIAHRVRLLTGGVWGHQKAQAFADADVVCLPSPLESFGLAAAEAAAVGLAVVVSQDCGSKAWLDPEGTRIFDPGVPESLSLALSDVLRSAAARGPDSSGSVRIREQLAWDAVAGMQADLYREILRDRVR